jgi:hypothetical protein
MFGFPAERVRIRITRITSTITKYSRPPLLRILPNSVYLPWDKFL